MESSTAAPEIEQSTAPEERDQSSDKVFRYNDWVHIGLGAQECDHAQTGRCTNSDHFHAWVRLPNKFQVTAIREKAQAARARVLRQAKDPDSDRSAIIDNQIAETVTLGRDVMIEELTARNTMKWNQRAMSETAEGEEGEENPFEHIEEDQRRFAELAGMAAEDRDDGEYQELIKHLESWNDTVEQKVAELKQPELDALNGKEDAELAAMLREQVVGEQANQVFMRVFSKWQYTICTMRPNKDGRMVQVFATASQLEGEAPEVVEALETTYKALEDEMAGRVSLRAEGN